MAIDVSNESGVELDELELVYQAEFVLKRLHINPAAELSILLVDEIEMAVLHEKYMDEPGSTDVLSFPMDEMRAGTDAEMSPEGILGDIVLCPEVASRQAVVAGHSFTAEFRLLLTHGILHLLGHDHSESEEHEIMFGLQAQLLAQWEGERNKRGIGS